MSLLYRILILNTLLLSVLGFGPDAKADVRQYQKCDYQGNNRVLTDYSGNAIERYDYYPYGGLFGEVNPEQWRLYGGKELQTMNGLNLHDFHARWQDHATCWFTTQDPLAEKYYALSPYTYCAGNPLKYTDSSGKYIETLWDVANVALGIGSFVDNVKQGNVGDAVLDGLGVVVDAAAVILPGVPGGAGAAIKGARAADDVVDAVKSVDNAVDISSKASKALKNTKSENTVTFIQGKGDKAKKITVEIPDGYRRINERSKDAPIYTNGKNYITPDVHGHNGGVWKMSKKTNTFKNRSVRTGTYDKDLNRIGD